MRSMLGLQGWACDVALQGSLGLELAERRFKMALVQEAPMYQIIIIEFSMPDMDGCEVTQAIRNIFDDEQGVTIPKPYICCVTSYNEAYFLRRAVTAGVDSFLTKPVSQE